MTMVIPYDYSRYQSGHKPAREGTGKWKDY